MTGIGPTGRTVLVTGGAGFIGSHLVEALRADNDVRVLDDLSSGRRHRVPDGVELVEGDLRDGDALDGAIEGVDLIYHEAAIVSVEQSVADPPTSQAVNATATLELLERARERDARVVLASSAAIYGHPESVPVGEDHRLEPTSPYGLQKVSLDAYARLYHDLYGLETVPLRYFNVYGPRQTGGDYSGVISVFLRQAREGGPITVNGDGEQTRDFVHVDDVVRANLLAGTTDAVGRAYNVGTGESVTVRRLAELIRDAVGSDAEIVHRDPRPGDIERSRADVSRARRELGFEPQVGLAQGLSTLVEATGDE
jgi:UDP-glucose 4-epimerase